MQKRPRNKCEATDSGDGGIRTRVPKRTNAFRVRLITTTLIRLQTLQRKL